MALKHNFISCVTYGPTDARTKGQERILKQAILFNIILILIIVTEVYHHLDIMKKRNLDRDSRSSLGKCILHKCDKESRG